MSVKTVSGFVHFIQKELKSSYPPEEIRQFVRIILSHLLGFSTTDILTKGDTELSERQVSFLDDCVQRLKKQEPVQYILGETEFLGLKLKVNEHTLIPRPETEELVMWVTEHINSKTKEVLDIGTGSGCIALGIKSLNTNATVKGWDVSGNALTIAKENSVLNDLAIGYSKVDILLDEPEKSYTENFDIIVSNPPYVRESEKKLMEPNVLDHEPHLALFVDDNDPLIFYRVIAGKAKKMLKPGGLLFFEINEAFGVQMHNLMEKEGFKDIEIKQDINGKDRMIKGRKE